MKSTLAYLGVLSPFPPNFRYEDRAPTPNDYEGFRISELWLVKHTEDLYMLTDKRKKVSTWTLLSGGIGTITEIDGGTNINTVDATGPVVTVNLDDSLTLAGDLTLTAGDITVTSLAEGVVQSDASGLLFANSGADGQVIVGNTTGAAGWSTLTSSDGTVVFTAGAGTLDLRSTGGGGSGLTSMPTDSGTATVSGVGTIDVLGGVNLNTVASGASIISVNLDNDVGVSGYLQAGSTVASGTTITAGTDLISTGSTTVGTDLTVSGLGLGVVQSSASGVFSSSVGTVGQLLISAGSGAPAWSELTAGTNVTIDDTSIPGKITISSSGGASGVAEVDGGTNITVVNPTGPIATINLDDDVTLVGYLETGTSVTVGSSLSAATTISATGNIASVSGNISAGGSVSAATFVTAGSDLLAPFGNLEISGTGTIGGLGLGVVQSDASGLLSSSAGADGQLLVGSSAGAPVWANLTSTGGTVTITNGANTINLEAVGGGGGVLAGDNLNIDPVGTMNLNKSISQPTSNASGSEGLYSLGGSDFMHNYGVGNTFLGESAGNRTFYTDPHHPNAENNTFIGRQSGYSILEGSSNTGVGSWSLEWNRCGIRNTAVGHNALRNIGNNVTRGHRNTAVGYGAIENAISSRDMTSVGCGSGSAFTEGNSWNCICLGSRGINGASNTMFLGKDPDEPHPTTQCRIHGVVGVVPNYQTNPRIMQIGNNGVVGVLFGKDKGDILMGNGTSSHVGFGTITSSGGTITIDKSVAGNINIENSGASVCAFRAYQSSGIADMTGNGTTYWLGANVALSEEYDIGGNFTPGDGDGANAKFTAPLTGLYNFTISILLTNLENPPPDPPIVIYVDPISIVTTGKTYQLINPALVYKGEQTLFYTVYAKMSAGNTAQFNCAILTDAATKTIGIGATHTWIGGFLVSAGV